MILTRLESTSEGRAARTVEEAFARLASVADEFEAYVHPHASRLATLTDEIARSFDLAGEDTFSLRIAALAHDLGELAMKRSYIKRGDALTEAERVDLARHPVIGEQEAARAGADRGAQLLVRWHHEWWNGAGYPDALRGEQIPLKARILRVADSYAALTDERPFRPAGTETEARKHLTLWAGLEFDPRVVHVFLTLKGLAELRSYARPPAALSATGATETDSRVAGARETDLSPAAATEIEGAGAEQQEALALKREREVGLGQPPPAFRH